MSSLTAINFFSCRPRQIFAVFAWTLVANLTGMLSNVNLSPPRHPSLDAISHVCQCGRKYGRQLNSFSPNYLSSILLMAWVDLPYHHLPFDHPSAISVPKVVGQESRKEEALTNLTCTRQIIGEIVSEWRLEWESTHDPSLTSFKNREYSPNSIFKVVWTFAWIISIIFGKIIV